MNLLMKECDAHSKVVWVWYEDPDYRTGERRIEEQDRGAVKQRIRDTLCLQRSNPSNRYKAVEPDLHEMWETAEGRPGHQRRQASQKGHPNNELQ